MKNRAVSVLAAFTILFIGITIGFSVGRHVTQAPVRISVTQSSPTVYSVPPTTAAEETAPTAPPPSTTAEPALINVNTADLDTLCTLPGIGPVLAQRIIDYRSHYGPFQSLEELTMVDGIGKKRLEAILDFVTLGG